MKARCRKCREGGDAEESGVVTAKGSYASLLSANFNPLA